MSAGEQRGPGASQEQLAGVNGVCGDPYVAPSELAQAVRHLDRIATALEALVKQGEPVTYTSVGVGCSWQRKKDSDDSR